MDHVEFRSKFQNHESVKCQRQSPDFIRRTTSNLLDILVSSIADKRFTKYQRCHFSGIFWISGTANLQNWIFLNFLDVLMIILEKNERITINVMETETFTSL